MATEAHIADRMVVDDNSVYAMTHIEDSLEESLKELKKIINWNNKWININDTKVELGPILVQF